MAKPRRSGLTGYERQERSVDRTNKNERYREFEDTTTHSHDFDYHKPKEGGEEQKKFIRETTNTEELMNELLKNSAEVYAFENWGYGAFMSGQQYGKFSDMYSELQKWTRTFDKYLDRVVNKEGFIVRRRATAELLLGKGNTRPMSLEQLQGMKGQLVTSKGSMSTSLAKHGLTIGDSSKKMEYEIRIPAGSKGAGMWIGDKRINGWGSRQREFMTNRDAVFQVGDTKYDPRRGVYVTQLTFIAHERHSYD